MRPAKARSGGEVAAARADYEAGVVLITNGDGFYGLSGRLREGQSTCNPPLTPPTKIAEKHCEKKHSNSWLTESSRQCFSTWVDRSFQPYQGRFELLPWLERNVLLIRRPPFPFAKLSFTQRAIG